MDQVLDVALHPPTGEKPEWLKRRSKREEEQEESAD
jgi:hypothetical protein